MNYQERVQALAEKMADYEYKLIPNSVDNWENDRTVWAQGFLPAARIAVAEMAEVYIMALKDIETNERIQSDLIYYGLIPSAQEGGSDGKE